MDNSPVYPHAPASAGADWGNRSEERIVKARNARSLQLRVTTHGQVIALINDTQQGISKIIDSPHRAEAARALARACGAEMKDPCLTLGDHDLVAPVEADSDEAMARFAFALGSRGNVRCKTLGVFTEEEFREIVPSLPK